jgi:pimeloyl-ACP methyl ester carboxylesterase
VSSALATPVNQIAAGVLDVGYADIGPADGPAVVLLHGWPYDIHTFADVSPRLAAEGYRGAGQRCAERPRQPDGFG